MNPVFLSCDRDQFIDCYMGDLMIRDERGVITHLGDAATHAVEAAEHGQTVLLTVNGLPFSVFSEGVETLIKDAIDDISDPLAKPEEPA